jgi:8-amino-7-oxononanoate synthase
MIDKIFSEELEGLRQGNLLRKIKDRQASFASCASRIFINGIEYINFASNDYLGLSMNPSVVEAAKKAMDEYGFGSGASRLLSGGTELNASLEKTVSEFKNTEAALVFNSGYTANISAIPAIAMEGDVIFSDELNHASIIDGCRLSKAKKVIYKHCDTEHLFELLKKENGNKKIVITDSVFSMDGDIAPLNDIYELCRSLNSELQTPNTILLYIDDAHGTGVLGNGYGALQHFKIKPEPWIIQMGTFSKALGSYGAFIAAGRNIIDWLINTARGFIYSTALPPCVIAASIKALQVLQDKPELVKKLWQNRERLFNGIINLGFDTLNSETPIIPILLHHHLAKSLLPSFDKGGKRKFSDVETTLKFSELLLNNHIYAPAIRPPTVTIPRIRFTVTASHTEEDIDKLLKVLAQL